MSTEDQQPPKTGFKFILESPSFEAGINNYLNLVFAREQGLTQENLPKWNRQSVNFIKLNFEEMAKNTGLDELGKYYLSKGNVSSGFEKLRQTVFDPNIEKDEKGQSFVGQPKWKWYLYLQKKYSQDYDFPGLEYEAYATSLPEEKIPQLFKDGNQYELIGFVVHAVNGNHNITALHFENGALLRHNLWLAENVSHDSRVVAFEDEG